MRAECELVPVRIFSRLVVIEIIIIILLWTQFRLILLRIRVYFKQENRLVNSNDVGRKVISVARLLSLHSHSNE